MFVNLTPHPIVFVDGPTVPPSGNVARVASTPKEVGKHDGVSLKYPNWGFVQGLPDPVDGVMYIVSAMVRERVVGRTDVASPGDLVRDEKGTVVGCRDLVVNVQ